MKKPKEVMKKRENNAEPNSLGRWRDAKEAKASLKPYTNIPVSRELVNYTHASNFAIERKNINLFRLLNSETRQLIARDGKEEAAARYMHLTQAEIKLLYALAALLYLHTGTDKNGKLALDNAPKTKEYYGAERRDLVILEIKPQELYREYTGKTNPSGREAANIRKTLKKLATTYRIITWKEGKRGTKITRTAWAPCLIILSQQKTTIKIALSPIFGSDSYVLRPRDIETKTLQAAGRGKISTATMRLRDYLLSFISSKKPYTEIGEIELIYLMGQEGLIKKYGAGGKKTQAKIKEALRVIKGLKIITEYSREPRKKGGYKYRFALNGGFLKDYGMKQNYVQLGGKLRTIGG